MPICKGKTKQGKSCKNKCNRKYCHLHSKKRNTKKYGGTTPRSIKIGRFTVKDYPKNFKKFQQKGFSEKKYANCSKFGCSTLAMPYCCPAGTPAEGYCRIDYNGCKKTGMKMTKRTRNVTPSELKKLRANLEKQKAIDRADKILQEEIEKSKSKLKRSNNNRYEQLLKHASEHRRRSQKLQSFYNRQKGGDIVGEGSFGCVVSPNLKCPSHMGVSDNKLSKLIKNVETFEEEVRGVTLIKPVDPTMKYILYPIDYCKLDKKINYDTWLGCVKCAHQDIKNCEDKNGTLNFNIIMKNGGNDLLKLNKIQENLLKQNFMKYYNYLKKGIELFHKNKIIHRDIKPDNIVLNNNGDIRFIDIGFLHKVENRNFNSYDNIINLLGARTIFYRPPDLDMIEVFVFEPNWRKYKYSKFFDKWQSDREDLYHETIDSMIHYLDYDSDELKNYLKNLHKKLSLPFLKKYIKENIYKWDFYSLQVSFFELYKKYNINLSTTDIDKITPHYDV